MPRQERKLALALVSKTDSDQPRILVLRTVQLVRACCILTSYHSAVTISA